MPRSNAGPVSDPVPPSFSLTAPSQSAWLATKVQRGPGSGRRYCLQFTGSHTGSSALAVKYFAAPPGTKTFPSSLPADNSFNFEKASQMYGLVFNAPDSEWQLYLWVPGSASTVTLNLDGLNLLRVGGEDSPGWTGPAAEPAKPVGTEIEEAEPER